MIVRTVVIALLALVVLALVVPVDNANATTSAFIGGNVISKYEVVIGPYPSPFFLVTKKLGRGVANMVTAPVEIIKQPLVEAEKADSVGEFINAITFHGLFSGVAWTFYRELDGVYALGTFYLPSLESTIDPEYIF